MFIGHFAVALAAKKAAPKVSLGTLFIAAQFVDLLWPLLVLIGLEHVRIAVGNTAFTPLDFYDYPISHSLAGALIWSVLFGLFYFLLKKDKKSSIIIAFVVFSHWILDFISHKPDLPLTFGQNIFLGLGLWNSVWGTLAVELSLFVAGLIIYLNVSKSKDRIGIYAFWSLIVLIVAIYFMNIFGPPPPNVSAIAIARNALWLLVILAYWADKHRKVAF